VLRLLAGAALVVLAANPALAQTLTGPGKATVAAPTEDGLDPNSFYLEADTISQDDKSKVATAEGHVEVRYRGRTLRAQRVTYNQTTGAVMASGDVVVINQDGTAEFAHEMEVDKDLRAGVALGFSARLKGNVKIAADSLIRRNVDVTELNRAIYTPCDICAKDGRPKTPSWSIQASSAVEDKAHHVIYYRHAVIRVLGVPIFYTPLFWNPDADAKARSGLLAPQLQISSRRGFSYEQPYLFVIDPSQDLVVSPILSSEVNPFLNLEWRKRFYSGSIDARFGYTYEREFDNHGDPIPGSALTSRSYVLAHGAFQLDSKWTTGFAAERVTDDLLFDRYDIRGVYEKRGLFETDSRRLLSQVYAVRQDQTSYLSISALDFQGLRIDDVNSGMPVVAPLIEGRFEPDVDILGGRLRVVGSAVLLNRKSSLTDPAIPGVDNHRATAEADWRRSFTFSNGLRVEPFGSGRFDYYSVSDLPGQTNVSRTTIRGIGDVGMDISYPLIKRSGDTTIILEPIAEGIYSQEAKPDPDIPNTDGADFVFDETNLFDPNRSPGFDVYDSGARLNLGERTTVQWGDGREARAFIGRSIRSSPDLTIPNRSGYGSRTSDWIMAASASPIRGLWLYERTQLDGKTLQLRRQEAGLNVDLTFMHGYLRYLHDYSDPSGQRENVEASSDLFFTRHWGMVVYGSYDLQNHVWERRDIGVVYQDECTRLELVYHHEAAFSRLGGPSNAVQVRLTLATLGEQSYRDGYRP
jgi:LPS-assembly protein